MLSPPAADWPRRVAGVSNRERSVHLERATSQDPRVVDLVGRYVAELDQRFPEGFSVAGPEDLVDPGGHYLLALVDGAPAAVGGVRAVDRPAGAAEVKRMWVDPTYRGLGLGRRLLAALEELAWGLGHRVVVLDTHRSLEEALGMYAAAGYREVGRYNANPYAQAFFVKDLPSTPRPGAP